MAVIEADVLNNRTNAGSKRDDGVSVTNSRELRSAGNTDADAGNNNASLTQLLGRPVVKSTLPYVGVALAIFLGIMVYGSVTERPNRALYPEMADSDKEAAQQLLIKNGLKVNIDENTGNLQVASASFHEARILLAAAGLPRQVGGGFAYMKENMPLGTSQFMEQARYNASIEEELGLSIRRINTVQDARVHLALPRQSAFVRDRAEPKASVIVTPFNGRALSQGQVQAIVHLVSSSIPYMTPNSVSVVDPFGHLLTEGENANDKQVALRSKLEADYVDRIIQLLEPIFGAGNVRAQATAEVDFSVIEQTTENYDPNNNGTKIRSEQSNEATVNNTQASGVPGSLSNTPPAPTATTATSLVPDPAAANAPGSAGAQTSSGTENKERSQSRNYEMDRSVRYVVDPAPRLQRLSVAVAINDAIAAPGATTRPARKPLPAAEITRLTNLIQGAVGFNATRGDRVNLISTSFEPLPVVAPTPLWQQSEYIELAKSGALTIAILLLAFLVVKPIMTRLATPRPAMTPQQMALLSSRGGSTKADEAPGESPELQEGETLDQLKARMKPKKSGISAEMLDTANSYDDKVTVVRMMVEQDARRVALVLKNLVSGDMG